MPELSRVLLVGPYPGRRWLSITRYCEAIAGTPGVPGVSVSRAAAPWWNPPSAARGLAHRWWRNGAFRADRSFPADVIHFADQGLAHHLRRFRGRPTVVTCHDLMPFVVPGFYRSSPERLVKQGFLRYSVESMRLATRVVTVSSWTASQISEVLGIDPQRISIVPNVVAPVYEEQSEPDAWLRARGVELPEGPRILSVGHAGAYKNLELLIETMATPELHGANLIRVGAPLAKHHRERVQALGLGPRVIELGGLSSARLARVYAACDALAQPSLGEGFGVPVIEAMACGLPVVASDRGALPEVVGDAGVLVNVHEDGGAGSPEAVTTFARALGQVIEDAGMSGELRRRGFERAAGYRAERVLPMLGSAYRKALSSSSR